ncbi:MAG TPA: hypothetical protein VN780_03440 [Candidatus Eisenbacteria bacterium]|jgi:hypothetical protein|nr:hypothetical protein [Candidatus Eisenbacteria bacterium]
MKITLHSIHCQAKTESDADEIYCTITTGDAQKRQLACIELGKFETDTKLQPGKLLWSGANALLVTITFMESDANEPNHGADDFIGEITASAGGNCTPGRCALDEGIPAPNLRQFTLTGSAARYVIQLQVHM